MPLSLIRMRGSTVNPPVSHCDTAWASADREPQPAYRRRRDHVRDRQGRTRSGRGDDCSRRARAACHARRQQGLRRCIACRQPVGDRRHAALGPKPWLAQTICHRWPHPAPSQRRGQPARPTARTELHPVQFGQAWRLRRRSSRRRPDCHYGQADIHFTWVGHDEWMRSPMMATRNWRMTAPSRDISASILATNLFFAAKPW